MTNEEIDALTLRVYRARLDAESPGDADRMVEKDGDGGAKQARRSGIYRPVIVETLVQLGLHERFTPKKTTEADLAKVEERVLAHTGTELPKSGKRTPAQKAYDYAVAYGMAPEKAEKLPKPRAKARKAS